ncbi:MAG: LacI family transcriptional regulator [Victivallales bacterium]|nr:LacI family transcriptional regulator [Victivallales bacterium]
MGVTLKDLASRLGVSGATVSMALRNSPRVSEEMRHRVQQLAKELYYVPNNFGRGLQSNRSHLLGYMLGSVTNSFLNELLETVGYASMPDGYGLLTGWVPDTPEVFKSQLALMLEKNVDALIFTLTSELTYPYLHMLQAHQKPFIFCSCYCPAEYNSVVGDHYLGGKLAVEHLAGYGHRAILVSECRHLEERRRGYTDAALDAGMVMYIYGDQAEIPEILKAHPEITAIAAFSDREALDIRHMLEDLGKRVPEDISLIGYDDLWFSHEREFNLTTVAQPIREIGLCTYQRLKEILSGDDCPRRILLPPTLKSRKSVTIAAIKESKHQPKHKGNAK